MVVELCRRPLSAGISCRLAATVEDSMRIKYVDHSVDKADQGSGDIFEAKERSPSYQMSLNVVYLFSCGYLPSLGGYG